MLVDKILVVSSKLVVIYFVGNIQPRMVFSQEGNALQWALELANQAVQDAA